MIKNPWMRLLTLAGGLLTAATAQAAWELNMPKGVTPLSHEIYGLHMMIFYVCCIVGVLVFGVMFYSVFAHRKSRHPVPASFHGSTLVEVIWTAVPFVILVAVAIPAIGTLIRMEDSKNAELTVRVSGYQWGWKYEYVDKGVTFYSRLAARDNVLRQTGNGVDPDKLPEHYLLEVDHRLMLPVGEKVRFLITARDVIHSWWVPALGMKLDAIPGYINDMWANIQKPGIYRGQCAELCGRDHGFMPVVVQAVAPEAFKRWLNKMAKLQTAKGEAAYVAYTGASAAAAAEPAAQVVGQAEAAGAAAQPVASAAQQQGSAVSTQPAASAEQMAAAAAPKTATVAAAANEHPAKTTAPAGDIDKATLMAEGKAVYANYCSACHRDNGAGMPPAFPALKGGKLVLGPAKGHIERILHGKDAMQAFAGILDDRQIAAVATYERNAWGNDSGVVQPAQVKALR